MNSLPRFAFALRALCVFAGLVVASLLAQAAPAQPAVAEVEQVLAPAWLERAGQTDGLRPGTPLQVGDIVRTGPDARVYLKLAEGSRIKLGADARFLVEALPKPSAPLYQGAFDVLTGAFRYTTDVLRRSTATRDIRIRVATAAIGIRGTDVWGKAGAERDLVALIEGSIQLERNGQALVIEPMQYLDGPRGGSSDIQPLPPELLAVLTTETEIEVNGGASRAEGKWGVRLISVKSRARAQEIADVGRRAGYACDVEARGAAAQRFHEVWVSGFATKADAAVAARRLQALNLSADEPQIGRP